MKLLTKELEKRFAEIGSQEGNWNPIVVLKIFNPDGAHTWYATEYDPEKRIFFGFVTLGDPDCAEWGYFSLDEIEVLRSGQLHLTMERDLYCGEHPASHYPDIKLYPPDAKNGGTK